jgi:hypothetical protein
MMPKVRANVSRLANYWLGIEKLPGATKDPKEFPKFTPAVQADLYTSAARFIDDTIWSGRLDDLFTSSRMFVNATIATAYGFPGVFPKSMEARTLSGMERSSGILSHPALTTALPHDEAGSTVVHRGLFVYNSLLCAPAVPEPPDSLAEAITDALASNLSEQQRATARAENSLCASCHSSFDPYGLLLESYDVTGRYRTHDANGKAVPTSVKLPSGVVPGVGDDGVGLNAFARSLAGSEILATCATRQLALYAFGGVGGDGDTCDLAPAIKALSSSRKVPEMLKALFLSPGYAQRSYPEEVKQ